VVHKPSLSTMTTTLAISRTSEQHMESAVVGRSGRWHCPAAYNPDHGPWFPLRLLNTSVLHIKIQGETAAPLVCLADSHHDKAMEVVEHRRCCRRLGNGFELEVYTSCLTKTCYLFMLALSKCCIGLCFPSSRIPDHTVIALVTRIKIRIKHLLL
jgi:hypothetical protein